MKRVFIFSLLLFSFAGANQTIAVLPSDGVLSSEELDLLTDKTREIALQILLSNNFTLLTQQAVIRRLGGVENYYKECKESSCIVDLGKKANADYVAQCQVSRLDGKLRIKMELYKVSTEALLGQFSDHSAENVHDLLSVLDEKAPEVFKKIPGVLSSQRGVPVVQGGISGLEKAVDYVLDFENRYLVNLNTEPQGAIPSFNGVPVGSCSKTPCKVELPEGNVRIVAASEQYETADTTISVRQNNQNVNIKLKPNFGILDIKPAYSENIGNNKKWNLTINNRAFSSFENRFSPGNYEVKLSHECYEDISFEVGITKGGREIFDMDRHIQLKMGGLDLSAEKDGEPVAEPVFVNGNWMGETPFSRSVPVCANIELGQEMITVNIKLERGQVVRYMHKMPDSQEWLAKMAEEKRRAEETKLQRRTREPLERHREKEWQEQAEKQHSDSWDFSLLIGFGLPFMMNAIDTVYYNTGAMISFGTELYKENFRAIRLGFNLALGLFGLEEKYIYAENPDLAKINTGDIGIFINGGIFLRLYPIDAFYLHGAANFGNYSGYDVKGCRVVNCSSDAESWSRSGTTKAVFPIGAGIVFSPNNVESYFIEGAYNTVTLKDGLGGYISVQAGITVSFSKWKKKAEQVKM